MWRIARERILLLGGPASLLLQIAHPLVAAAVHDHSEFRRDPFARLRATLEATLRITFGDVEQARAAARSVRRTHARVNGVAPDGRTYDATDRTLSLWVHATLVWTSMRVYEAFVEPLGDARRQAYYDEGKPFAALFGVRQPLLPKDVGAFDRYVERMLSGGELAVDRRTRELAGVIVRPPLPLPLRAANPPMRLVTTWLLPRAVADMYGFDLEARDAAILRAAVPAARTALKVLPAGLRFWPHWREAERRAAATAEAAS